jgi:aldehyde dehydrogenase (NAD+)
MGVIGVVAPDESPLLGLLTCILPPITSGNSVVVITSETAPYPAIALGEMLATSDLPGGVVNLLTGFRKEMVPTFATHEHIRGIGGVVNAADRKTLEEGGAESMKRVKIFDAANTIYWQVGDGPRASLYAIADFVEFKTTWHPVGA